MSYSQLDRKHLIETVGRLRGRIEERFPDAGLLGVAHALSGITQAHAERSARIRRPVWLLRTVSLLLLLTGATLLGWLFWSALSAASSTTDAGPGRVEFTATLQNLEAALSMLFFLGAAGVYVASLELRSKRRRCLEALHELRALAHIVDLHQLTKDPDRTLHPNKDMGSSSERALSPFLLTRYLDYCSEILSLIGKVAALYAQEFPDPQAIDAVDDIEDLTTGLSRKIWQKIMILANHPAVDQSPA